MATLFDDASLVMIPSGYKDDKLYSIKPTSGDGDFTFSRDGSGASPATRVNASGLIEKGRTNILLQSNSFGTTWVNAATTETSGQSGYDGTNDAWLIDKSASGGYIYQDNTQSGVLNCSVYAKAGTRDWMNLTVNGSSTFALAYFDLANGTINTTQGSGFVDAQIEDVGSGWYRCSITTKDGSSRVRIYPADGDNNVSGTSGNIYIQDAQLEKGLVATSYIETTTAAASAGILGDMPRLDYSGGATCPSLLLEPARTNLITQSEYFDSWFYKTGISITSNDTTSPEGVVNGSKLETTSAGSRYLGNNYTLSTGDNSFSVFAKKGSTNWIYLNVVKDGANNWNFTFDLENGVLGQSISSAYSVTAKIEDYGSGWYRITATANVTSAGLFTARIYPADSATDVNTSIGDNIYIYGAQIEASSYPTSYIPTYGSATARAKDFFVMNLITNGITTAIQTEASLFVEFEKPNTDENVDLMRWRGSGTLGRGFIYNTAAGFASDWGSSQQLNIGGGDNNKVVWRLNSLTSGTDFINGTKGIGSTGTAWSDIRELRFNAEGGGGVLKIKQIALFPTALTDAECISLTTI